MGATAGDIKRTLLVIAGTICVVLSILGMVLPVLPTTPFLLLAAICYERSSPRFHNWLLTNRWFGAYLKNYREGRGIPLREKVLTLTVLWISIGYGVVFVTENLWLRILLLSVAFGVTIHLIRTKTLREDDEDISAADV